MPPSLDIAEFYAPGQPHVEHGHFGSNTDALLTGISSAPSPKEADELGKFANKKAFDKETARQTAELLATAKKLKILSPALTDKNIDYEGGEHYLHFGDESVTKETLKGEYGLTFSKELNFIRPGLPNEYLERVKMLNKVFPEQPIEVVGVTKQGAIITSTPLVRSGSLKVGPDGDPPGIHPTAEKIAKFLGGKGYKSAGGRLVAEYYNPNTKIRLSDCEPKNFLVDGKGTIHAVDVIPSKVGISKKAGISSKLFSRLYDELAEFYSPDQPRDSHGRWAGSGAITGVGKQTAQPATHNARQAAIDAIRQKLAAAKNMAREQAKKDAADKKVRDDWFTKRGEDLKNQKAKQALVAHGNAKAVAAAAKAWNDKLVTRKELKDQLKKIKEWNDKITSPIDMTAVAKGDPAEVQRAADAWNDRHHRFSALVENLLEFYSPDQPRDDHGRFGSGDRYQLGLTTNQDVKSFDPEVFEVVRRRIEKALYSTPGILKASVHPSEGMYFGSKEPSYDAEFTVPKGADITPINELVKKLAAENKQEAAFVTKVTTDKKTERPLLEIAFKKPITEDEATKLSNDFTKAGLGGFTIAKDDKGNTVGVRTQSIPEFGGDAHSTWASSAKKMIAGMDKSNIARTTMRHADTHIFQRGKDY